MPTYLQAPYPTCKVTTVLPNAKFGDSRAPEQSVLTQRSMRGNLFTTVKNSPRHKRLLPFELSRMKALELQEFVRAYYGAKWKVTLHDGSVWVATLLNQAPLVFTTEERAGGWPGGEMVAVELELSCEPLELPVE